MTEGAGRGGQGAGGSGSADSPAPRTLRPAPRTARPALHLFLLTFVTYAFFFNGGGWNQNAQFDLTRALVERQTLHIDGYRVNTGDISWSPVSGEWHAYINKPPGVSFLAAIPYAAIHAIERAANVPIDSWKWMTINAWLVTALTCGVTGALVPVLLFLYGRRLGKPALAVALAIAFGTITMPYATMLFAHVPAAFFLLLAFVWLDERPLLAGAAAGIASTCFYICIPAALVLLVAARRKVRFALGGLPFAILLGVYHQLCFGSPFRTSVETSRNFTEEGLLFGVFRAPSLDALWGLTFAEYRGLFFLSPFLVLAFFAWRERRREVVTVLAVFAVFLLAIASFNNWDGGHAVGPRYLLPAVPLLGIPLLFVRTRLVVILAIPAVLMNFAATAVNPIPSGPVPRPITGYVVPKLLAGEVSINQQAVDELVPHQQHPPGSHESTWASLNVGELAFGASTRMALAPIALWMVVGGALLARRRRT